MINSENSNRLNGAKSLFSASSAIVQYYYFIRYAYMTCAIEKSYVSSSVELPMYIFSLSTL